MAKQGSGARDAIGKRGEAIATASLIKFWGNPLPYFDPHPLGEKCPTYDLLVELLGAGPSPPYFFAQVKSTQQGYNPSTLNLRIDLKAKDVKKMIQCPIPTYLIGVDEPAEMSYIVSIHGGMKGRISSMPTTYPLNRENLGILWNEVKMHWESLGKSAGMKTSAFAL